MRWPPVSGFRRTACFAALLLASRVVSAADRVAAAGGEILITPVIHSSVQIEYGPIVIQIDPWSAGDLSAAKPADLILVTDDPVHHLDVAAIRQLRKPGAPVIIPAIGRAKLADGTVLANGEAATAAGVKVQAVPAYDLTPGEPYHAKGKSNGYLITIGGTRVLIAGIGECVPELRALKNVDVAFVPVNLPLGRMAPAAAAECVAALSPRIVYPYHYDQAYAAAVANPRAPNAPSMESANAHAAVEDFVRRLAGEKAIEVRLGPWYPPR
jgi:L-ascorbate metabolism protein UlaG (beta-lactamase superfamily)